MRPWGKAQPFDPSKLCEVAPTLSSKVMAVISTVDLRISSLSAATTEEIIRDAGLIRASCHRLASIGAPQSRHAQTCSGADMQRRAQPAGGAPSRRPPSLGADGRPRAGRLTQAAARFQRPIRRCPSITSRGSAIAQETARRLHPALSRIFRSFMKGKCLDLSLCHGSDGHVTAVAGEP